MAWSLFGGRSCLSSICARFGFERVSNDLKTRLMVVSRNGRTVGLLVDSSREFIAVEEANISPPPEAVTGLSGKYLTGIVQIGERLALILDIDEILNFRDLSTTLEAS